MTVSTSAYAADAYKGVDALVTQIAQASTQTSVAEPSLVQLAAAIDAYGKNSASLAPKDAARQWVDLVVRCGKVSNEDQSSLTAAERARVSKDLNAGDPFTAIIQRLPGPAAWPAIGAIIDAMPVSSSAHDAILRDTLQLITHTLNADPAGQRKAIAALLAIQDPDLASQLQDVDLPSLDNVLDEAAGAPSSVAAAFQAKIDTEKKIVAASTGAGSQFATQFAMAYYTFNVPDLVTLLGGERQATPLITEAILLPVGNLNITGQQTTRLAAKLALEQAANLKVAHWELACSLGSAALYEALLQRFPPTASPNDYYFKRATVYHFFDLITSGQTAKAIAMAPSITEDRTVAVDIDALNDAGYTTQVRDFLHDLLAKHPEYPFWTEYISLATTTGQADEMLAFVRSMAGAPGIPDRQKVAIHRSLYLALLAADHVDEGVAELRKEMAASAENPGAALEGCVAIARIGQLENRQDLIAEGVAGAERHLATDPIQQMDSSPVTSLAELLVQLGRGPEAEKILAQTYIRLSASGTPDSNNTISRQNLLAALMRVYYQAGRPDDVLALLRKLPGWGGDDLKDILTVSTDGFSVAQFSTHAAPDDYSVGYMAAWALAQKGEKDEALTVDNALLDQDEDFDPAYELLLKLSGANAIPRLDQLASRDRFATRPLIWKAQLQLDAGQLDAAEKTVRAAITVDPSDGEQGPGRRMRAYALLAEVLERKGDKDHALTYQGAVDAIRISEHADRYYEAGLLTHAVSMYREALTHFSDAYCIQSRLALRLSELGDNAGAEEHYRRAYELMPESFGRVESHCFGCERAFDGRTPQGIAEKVFNLLAIKMPAKPQVHYLLGYLRYEEDRYIEALPEFQKAVQLDPDYLNAWKKIGELSDKMYLAPSTCNQVALNQVRLDPLQRHGQPQALDVTDLAGLWNAVAAAQKIAPAPSGPLLPLTASASEVKPTPRSATNMMVFSPSNDDQPLTPSGCIAQNRFIAAAVQILSGMPNWTNNFSN